MKGHMIWATAGVVLTACGGRQAVELDSNPQKTTPHWNAALATPAELAGALQINGTGWMAAPGGDDSTHTQASAEISNAAPGGRHPWHIHRGRCGNDLGIFGDARAYPVLEVGSEGRARANATLQVPPPASGDYFINVHASPTNMRTIIACGNLAPPAR